MHTEVYRRQHEQLRVLLDQTSRSLVPLDAEACRAGLGRLANVLNVHLALEDRALYPRLMTHDDLGLRKTAREFQMRMGSLAHEFRVFYERWIPAGAIESSSYDFALAYRAMSAALRRRMELEDTTLYRMVDSIL